ncbi:MAG TPA: hypothetical protein VGK23_03965 [Methanomassiliicoccales archaeon]
MVGIFVVLSSIGFAMLLQKERTTGGMDVLWKQTGLGTTTDGVQWINDSAIINDQNDKEIRCIGPDGSVEWIHTYSEIHMLMARDGHICFAENEGGITFTCLDRNGSVEWTRPDPWVNETPINPVSSTYGLPGLDGNVYLFGPSGRSVLCVDGSGFDRWAFTADNGAIGLPVIYSDGTVLIAHVITNASSLNSGHPQLGNGEEIVGEELIRISPNGTVDGRLEIPGFRADLRNSFDIAVNGTLTFSSYNFSDMTGSVLGISEHLEIVWSSSYSDLNAPVQGEGSIVYYLEHHSVEIDSSGGLHHFTTLCAYNTSNSSLLYRTDFSGTFTGGIIVSGDTVFLSGNDKVWAVGPDGEAHIADSSGWAVFGPYGGGLLLYDGIGIRQIGATGSTDWQFDLDSGTIRSLHLSSDGTIIVYANDGFTAIHKPSMSTNMIYMVGLVALDLLVVLTAGIWILDRWSAKERGTP